MVKLTMSHGEFSSHRTLHCMIHGLDYSLALDKKVTFKNK